LTQSNQLLELQNIQSVFFDNSQCSAQLLITILGTNHVLTCPANSQGFLPIIASDRPVIEFASSASAGFSQAWLLTAPVGGPFVFATGPQSVSITNTQLAVQAQPGIAGGWSYGFQSALSTAIQTVKGAAGNFGGGNFYNPNTGAAYIQVFDAASPVLGAPNYALSLPGSGQMSVEWLGGVSHANSIKVAAATSPTGITALTTPLVATFLYK
jgi:hypothetical protein